MTSEAQSPGDTARRRLGFLSLGETTALANRDILLPDPASVLVSADVQLEAGIILWPNVILQTLNGGRIAVGQRTQLFSGTRIVASGGTVRIGAEAEIGDSARLLGGGSLSQSNRIGRGAQILGPIRCQNCTLGDGGTYRDPEPDERGGVLKGSGVARNVEVAQGHVIQAFGLFTEAPVRRQSDFHPKA